MHLAWDDPVVLAAAVAAILLILYVIQLNLKAQKAKPAPAAEEGPLVEDDPLARLLVRFVKDAQGNAVGETVSADGDLIIIKQGSTYKAVPASHLEESGPNLVVRGVLDWTQAERLGAEWLARSAKPQSYTHEELRRAEEEG